ncbi:GntR family transcriptional regulator [Paenibacillus nasutitermitis]|uniref:GntR family transcriptional regulator n=1 Tax=Paenibacillus nasutitermitis TaxID=1652958 RepID=A0A916YT17_9BACL|nr:GntR family transcriptional regulator [Paenibacillus nasutitermitis]GGD60072.1 GntR family transcriptional regulator [Paenibacillus nasutitermitis]
MQQNLNALDKNHLSAHQDIKEAVYILLKNMIMKREFTPNERIDSAEIAGRLGISRTPVRDALNMLDAEGFIRTVPRQGIYVKGIYRKDLIELFQYREMVELFAIDAGFDHLQSQSDQILSINRQFEIQLDPHHYDGNQVMECDIELHRMIVASARNETIEEAYDKLNGHVQMARAYYLQDMLRIQQAHQEHQAFILALKAGDKDAAKAAMKYHLDQTLASLLGIIDIYKVF